MIYILTYTYAHIHIFPLAKLSYEPYLAFFQIHGLLYFPKYINITFCIMILACMFSKMIIRCTTH